MLLFCRSPHNVQHAALVRAYKAVVDPLVTTEWLFQHLNEVTVLDVRGHVDTVLLEPGVEKSTYIADYNEYLEGHIPVRSLQLPCH